MMTIEQAGALTTVQDGARKGYAATGYPCCGAADAYAMALGNLLVGNGAQSNAAVLECTLMGASIRFATGALVAITGGTCNPMLDGVAVATDIPLIVGSGQLLTLGGIAKGLRVYLAVYGGVDVPLVMGSRATDLKCGIGGFNGRALKNGDVLPLAKTEKEAKRKYKALAKAAKKHHFDLQKELEWCHAPLARWRVLGEKRVPVLRAVLGPQEDAFLPQGIASFEKELYVLTADCNRMACKLKGTAIATVNGSDILSDGIVEGSVQVASDGQPIVMMADHQTTGGYAKIATVIPPDLAVLAQMRPGEEVAFCFVTPEQAVALCRDQAKRFEWLEEQYQ